MKRWWMLGVVALATATRADAGGVELRSATPESVGVPATAIDGLRAVVQGFVERDEIVGAEVLVVKDHAVIWNEGVGFRDRERKEPMVPETIFCIRSMTKSVVGTAAQMLIDEGKLSLDDPVSKYLKSFDTDACRGITLRQLMTHTAGLHLSLIIGKDIKAVTSVREVADLSGAKGPEFPPGESFHYSDQGADTLTAVIEVAAGMTAEEFVDARVLKPLGMSDSACVLKKDDPRAARASSGYIGGTGAWSRYNDTVHDGGIFPTFLGSQAMYSTPRDYAKLLVLWMDKGLVGGERLLSDAAIERGLAASQRIEGMPTSLSGADAWYGQMWMVYAAPSAGGAPGEVLGFGHSGSDGTYSWAFPERGLTVLYFTQSRGETTGFRFEEAMQHILLEGDTAWRPASQEVTAESMAGVAGVYDAGEKKGYRAVFVRDGRLMLEIPGKWCGPLTARGGMDEWVLEQVPGVKFNFERDAGGAVVALVAWKNGESERMPRFVVEADLPSAKAVVELMRKGHGADALAAWGAYRVKSKLTVRGMEGTATLTVRDERSMRMDVDIGGTKEVTLIVGDKGWKKSGGLAWMSMDAGTVEHVLRGMYESLFGDWLAQYKDVRVMRRAKEDSGESFAVRCMPEHAYPSRRFIDTTTGLLRSADAIIDVPGLGVLGVRVVYDDFREIEGVKIPYAMTSEFITPILGKIVSQVESVETHVSVEDADFAPPAGGEKGRE